MWEFNIIIETPIYSTISDGIYDHTQELRMSYRYIITSRELKDEEFTDIFLNRIDYYMSKEQAKFLKSNTSITQWTMIVPHERICYYWEWEHF